MSVRTALVTCVLGFTVSAGAVAAHPRVGPVDARCPKCHADKTRGRSVHSAAAAPCTVCHLVDDEGEKIILATPKEKICFTCHEEAAARGRHRSRASGDCLDCHDSHSSSRRMLLRGGNQPKSFARSLQP